VAVVNRGEGEDFMGERPVRDVPGIGRKAARVLGGINVTRVKDLRRFSISYLEKIFGRSAYLISEHLRGRDPYVPGREPRSVSRETSLGSQSTDTEEILSILYYLTERACRWIRTEGYLPGRVGVKIRYGDGEGETRSERLVAARVLDAAVYESVRRLFLGMYGRRRVHLVGVALSRLLPARDIQELLYPAADSERMGSLYGALDEIRSRFGHMSVMAGRSINLIPTLERDSYGYILRTPSLTK
jgi:DNA polymerase-4